MENYKKIEKGVCPVCGETMLEYGCIETADDMIFYPWICKHCNTSGEEWYKLSFTGHNVNTEDGQDILEI